MISIHVKVFLVLVFGVICLASVHNRGRFNPVQRGRFNYAQRGRFNSKRWSWPDDGHSDDGHSAIGFPVSPGSHSHSPPQSPPHSPTESESPDFPAFPRSFPSPKPGCALNLECDAPCDKDEDYNATIRARIDTLIHQSGGANSILKSPVFKALLEEENIPVEERLRFRGGIIESPVCTGEETVFFPERAKTAANDWAFVLNQGEIKQGIKFERCISNGTKCNLGPAGSEIETVCRQKYIYKKMLVMDGQGSKILPESVLMPSCCVCYVMKPFNGFGRVGPRNDECV